MLDILHIPQRLIRSLFSLQLVNFCLQLPNYLRLPHQIKPQITQQRSSRILHRQQNIQRLVSHTSSINSLLRTSSSIKAYRSFRPLAPFSEEPLTSIAFSTYPSTAAYAHRTARLPRLPSRRRKVQTPKHIPPNPRLQTLLIRAHELLPFHITTQKPVPEPVNMSLLVFMVSSWKRSCKSTIESSVGVQ
jgi:hypothetical protein